MDNNTLNSIFEGISDDWKELLVRELRPQLTYALTELNKCIGKDMTISQLCPQPQNIFNFARMTPYHDVKIVLIGQDPYIGKDEAHGLSFSTNKGIPPSLIAIYNNLASVGLIKNKQPSGNLEHWARQGVLLLNAALTTKQGKSGAHKNIWIDYTDKIIERLSNSNLQPIFILLGNDAMAKRRLIASKCTVYTWGHPSPLNRANKIECPANFKYCDAFKLAHEQLLVAGKEIIWDRVEYDNTFGIADDETPEDNPAAINVPENIAYKPIELQRLPSVSEQDQHSPLSFLPQDDVVYVFTDGGCIGNGRSNANSSYAFCIVTSTHLYKLYGLVELVNIAGETFKTSNNRGELFGVSYAIHYIRNILCGKTENNELLNALKSKNIMIVSDSKYTIGCYSKWGFSWRANGDNTKKNLDIIFPTLDTIDELTKIYMFNIKYYHIHSHKDAPKEHPDLFYWTGNYIADKLCESALRCA
jgi:uracil-DNA glycosylase